MAASLLQALDGKLIARRVSEGEMPKEFFRTGPSLTRRATSYFPSKIARLAVKPCKKFLLVTGPISP
jgi:hypothetical protein